MIAQIVINGLITGILCSLMAMGFALIYNTTRVFHIAAAGIYVFAAYMFWFFSSACGLPLLPSSILSILLTSGLSMFTDVGIYRPLKKRNASLNVTMIASIGVMTVIVNLVTMLFGNDAKTVGMPFYEPLVFGNITLTIPQIIQTLTATIVLCSFLIVLKKTSWGIRLRAMSADETLFETLGYDINSTRNAIFIVSGAFIATASCLTVFDVGMDANMGMKVLVYALVAMVIGGIGRYWTCLVGGLIFGILHDATDYYVNKTWVDAIIFILLLVLLFLRPRGAAGYKQRTI